MLNFKYWFTMRPGDLSFLAVQTMAGFLLFLVVLAFFSFLIKKRVRGAWQKVWQSLNSLAISNFIIGIFLLFFGYEHLPFLAMRIWILVWAASIIFWLGLIVKKALVIKNKKMEMEKEKEFKKYIP